MGIDLLGPYLQHVHVKNNQVSTVDVTNNFGLRTASQFTSLNAGIIDWSYVLQHLQKAGYDGWLSLKIFGDIDKDQSDCLGI